MDYARFAPLLEWLAAAGLSGQRELNLLQGFCERAVTAGLPLGRAVFGVDTLHPVLEGRVFYWERDAGGPVQSEYGRLDPERSEDKWLQSPFHQLYETGATTLRQRLANEPLSFPVLEELRQRGMTDYVAMVNRFGAEGAIGLMDCTYSSWASDRASGFDTDDLAALEFLVPSLALAIKGASTAHIIETLVETYLGRDAGHRVLSGHISAASPRRSAPCCGSATCRASPGSPTRRRPSSSCRCSTTTPMRSYPRCTVQGGEVLKFIGDGILAIFDAAAPQDACRQALDAAADAIRRVGDLNQRRATDGLPVTHFYLGLHVGEVFYGNIGSHDRLDFTVVGPAVNETSRIAAMCRSLDQDVLLSSAFAEAAGPSRRRLVSVGRYALRGVQRPQELYTLEPEVVG